VGKNRINSPSLRLGEVHCDLIRYTSGLAKVSIEEKENAALMTERVMNYLKRIPDSKSKKSIGVGFNRKRG